jgi:DNA ligase D
MALETYRSKRDFSRTSEPKGRRAASRGKVAQAEGRRFVIQKHAATRLHYDFRLEHKGVLLSWAVTRGPSLDPSEKRLAVHVEDHPLEYASFEGTIPKGEYGGGSVIVWDEGTWEPDFDVDAGLKKGHLEFTLHGDKLAGRWHLVRLKPRPGEKRDNWLLMKSDDAFARPGEDILAEAPQSVKSGLTIEEIGEKSDSVWHSRPKGEDPKGNGKAARSSRKMPKPGPARKGPARSLPDFIPPALATLQKQPPAGPEWVHEVKFDGYRIQARRDGTSVRLLTRTGLDWTERFGNEIARAIAALPCDQAILDGEIVVLGDDGVASFSALQAALSERNPSRMVYYVFDLLHLDGDDLTGSPQGERKQRLAELLGDGQEGPLRYSEHFQESGQTMLTHACRMGLEGVVSKRVDAPYRSGRSLEWIKSKCTLRQEFVIGGYLPSDKTGRGLRSLLVGYHEDGKLRYAGRVGTGFSAKVADDLKERLDRLKAPKSPFADAVPEAKKAVWTKPDLAAEIEFRTWTGDRLLRQASFQGLREDKPADEVVKEEPAQDKPRASRSSKAKAPAGKAPAARSGRGGGAVNLSSADKELWPDDHVTKQDLLDHYERVWTHLRPFVVNRPLSLVRAPDGIEGQRFFQKHASPGMHASVRRMADPKDGEELLYIEDFDGLAALVQLGVVEVHIWGSTVDALEMPDQVVFDLDPDPGIGIDRLREATEEVRAHLEELNFATFLKTSGGKGFHVIAPLKPSANWTEVKAFAHDFARAMEQAAPDRYTATLSKKARKGRIFIDYLRNGRGSTTVAPWSTRGRKGATVSVPIEWDDLGKLEPDSFAIGSRRLTAALAADDPWKDFFKKGRKLTRS